MKIRLGFVSNSSSCSFTILNKANHAQTLEDLMRENLWMVKAFKHEFSWYKDVADEESVLEDARTHNVTFEPGESRTLEFEDHDGGIFESIMHYFMWDGGESDTWEWVLDESHH